MTWQLAAGIAAFSIISWVSVGTYVSVILHRGLAHRALFMPQWFMDAFAFWTAVFVMYVNPKVWVAEHRLHHAHSDTDEDPDKKPGWGLARFTWWSLANPAGPRDEHVARLVREPAMNTPVMKLLSEPAFGVVCQLGTGQILPYVIFTSTLGYHWGASLAAWFGVRLGGIFVKMIQGYFSHHKDYGYRNFETTDVSNNLNGWIPTILSAGESLQNNHHARPTSPTHAFRAHERDPGYLLVMLWQRMGVLTLNEKDHATPVPQVAGAA